MSIGTNLFARLATDNFSRLQGGISALQGQIASGVNDPRPSADPLRAIRLSAANEMQARLERYATNTTAAEERLAMTDTVLADVSSMTRQLREIALQSVNGTMSKEGSLGLQAEALRIRDALVGAANLRDAAGQPLFSGYAAGDAFAEGPDGNVRYQGDTGRTSLRVSESVTLTTSLNGADVFSTGPGGESLFKVIDDLVATLGTSIRESTVSVEATRNARLTLPADRGVTNFGFRLEGPMGAVDIAADLTAEVPGPMIDAINAASVQTGISASLGTDGTSIMLASTGKMSLSAGVRSDGARETVAYLQPLDDTGVEVGTRKMLRPDVLSPNSFIGGFDDAVSNMAAQRAEAGALARVAERQSETLAARKVQVTNAVTNLEELDMAEAVTRLQTLLMTQEAAQQSFVRIRSTGLFDYLR